MMFYTIFFFSKNKDMNHKLINLMRSEKHLTKLLSFTIFFFFFFEKKVLQLIVKENLILF